MILNTSVRSNRIWLVALAGLASVLCFCAHNPGEPAATPPALRAALPTSEALTPVSYLLGQFDPASHSDFVAVGRPYSDRPDMRMRKEAFAAFQKMYEAAKAEGVTLRIISSTRSFSQQKAIWEGKWERFAAQTPDPRVRALRILEYSSMPGTSRHHWGTDIDLNDLNDAAFVGKGAHRAAYEWLSRKAGEFGFCQPYSAGRPTGYQEEKWHWSYMPLASRFLSDYERQIGADQIRGFRGDSLAAPLDVVKRYVAGISPKCHR